MLRAKTTLGKGHSPTPATCRALGRAVVATSAWIIEPSRPAPITTADSVLPPEALARLAGYKRAVAAVVPGVEKLILFGSRARGQASKHSDYDIAVIIRDLSDRRHVGRILSDLAYDHILNGFFIRPIPLPSNYLSPQGHRPTELAEDIARDGIDIP